MTARRVLQGVSLLIGLVLVVQLAMVLTFVETPCTKHYNPYEVVATGNSTNGSALHVACLVILPKLHDQLLAMPDQILSSWGQHCDKLLFSTVNEIEQPHFLFEGKETGDRYHARLKQAMLQIAGEGDTFDWILIGRPQQFFLIENFKRVVSTYYSSTEPIYLGWKSKQSVNGKTMHVNSYRAGTALNYASFDAYMASLTTPLCEQAEDVREDIGVAQCLSTQDVFAEETLDPNGRQRFLPMVMNDFFRDPGPKEAWFLKESDGISLGTDACCSPELVSIHVQRMNQMSLYYYMFYEILPFE